jgi:hypothetical protein
MTPQSCTKRGVIITHHRNTIKVTEKYPEIFLHEYKIFLQHYYACAIFVVYNISTEHTWTIAFYFFFRVPNFH